MKIRHSGESDRAAIESIHADAFGAEQGPEIVELVNGLFEDPTAAPVLSLVAEIDGRLCGHVLFTAARLDAEPEISTRILAPLAVSGDCQGAGVGSALVREGLKQLAAAGVELVFVLGHPEYYPKFGFLPAGERGYDAPYPIPAQHANAWMVLALKAGVTGTTRGTVRCAETLNQGRHWQE